VIVLLPLTDEFLGPDVILLTAPQDCPLGSNRPQYAPSKSYRLAGTILSFVDTSGALVSVALQRNEVIPFPSRLRLEKSRR